MQVLKCEMCGGNVIFTQGNEVGICENCGTKQSITKTNNYENDKKTVDNNDSVVDVKANTFVKRGNISLEDKEWKKADKFFEKALNTDAECAEAYIGKFLSRIECSNFDEVIEDEKIKINWHLNNPHEDIIIIAKEDALNDKERNEYEEHIREQISKYSIPKYLTEDEIKKMYSFDDKLNSRVKYINFIKKETLESIKNDTIFKWAISFAKNDTKRRIDEFINNIEKLYEERANAEKGADDEEKKNKRRDINELFEKKDKELVDLHDEKQKQIIISERKKNRQKKVLFICIISIVIFVMSNIIYGILKTNAIYNEAVNLYNQEKYDEAYEVFNSINEVNNDIKEFKEKCIEKMPNSSFIKQVDNSKLAIKITSKDQFTSVNFGDIEWIVLERYGGKALLLSRYIVDCQKYNESFTDTTWEECTLRSYLNSTFINEHFSEKEKEKILITDVVNEGDEFFGTIGGNDTKDKIFILSSAEAESYFINDEMRSTCGTDYAKTVNNNALRVLEDGNSFSWLRSPGMEQNRSNDILANGLVSAIGAKVNDFEGVRPALWVKYK